MRRTVLFPPTAARNPAAKCSLLQLEKWLRHAARTSSPLRSRILVESIDSIGTTWLGLDAVSFVAPPQHSHRYACVGAPSSRRRSLRHLVPIQPIHSTSHLPRQRLRHLIERRRRGGACDRRIRRGCESGNAERLENC